ncbi:SDR family oxidoreductase [Patescibacteria group bacterium]|nr:MAG: SDR family oxidoreductase [Patescibacteria group bacterium]
MKFLIIGATGLVGRHLLSVARRRGHETVGTFCSHPEPGLLALDITDPAAVATAVAAVRPEAILLAAAEPNVDFCEQNPEASRRVNVAGTNNVAAAAARLGVPLAYFSSDYIFDGAAGPYRETDTPNPISEYGRQKLQAERLIAAELSAYLIIRTTGVYGAEPMGKNFVARLGQRLGAGETVRVPSDQYGNPTSASDLAECVVELLERSLYGVYNVSGPERLSRLDFAKIIAEELTLDPRLVQPVTTATLKQTARRPLQGGFILDKLRAAIGRDTLPPRAGLRAMRKESSEPPRRNVGAGSRQRRAS